MTTTLTPAAYRLASSLFAAVPRAFIASPAEVADVGARPEWWRLQGVARLVAAIEGAPDPDAALAELFAVGLLAAHHPSGAVVVRPAGDVDVEFPGEVTVRLPWPARAAHLDRVLEGHVDAWLSEVAA